MPETADYTAENREFGHAAARRVSCGTYHSMVVTEQHELYVWGGNYYGQVGNGTTADVHKPICIMKENVIACAAGKCHSLAVTTAGEVYAWGNNDDCLLGTGWRLKQETPVRVIDSGIKAVSAGWKHCLALTHDGEVLAWGGNDYGQLGDGTKTDRRSPVKVHLRERVVAIESGWYHNLAITEAGDVYQWGFTCQDPQSGVQHLLTPHMVINGGVKTIAAGAVHSLALIDDGSVLAWGGNDQGQLGDGGHHRRISPVHVCMNCVAIAAGSYHSVALDENSNILQWGFKMACTGKNFHDGSWDTEFTPSKVHLDGGAFSLAAGGVHSMAVSHSGEVLTWGGNSCGQIGDGRVKDREWPYTVLPTGTVETIPLNVTIARMMKGPAELEKYEAKEESESRIKARTRSLAVSKPVVGPPKVPELLHKIVGNHPSTGARLGQSYPLSFNGSCGLPRSSMSTGGLGFVPGTGFRPNTSGNSIAALTWPEGPGLNNPLRRHKRDSYQRPLSLTYSGPATDPGAFSAGKLAALEDSRRSMPQIGGLQRSASGSQLSLRSR